MDKGPATGDIWEFTTHNHQHVYFLVGEIQIRDHQRDRVRLITICDTTDYGSWSRQRVSHDLVDLMVDSTKWRRVA